MNTCKLCSKPRYAKFLCSKHYRIKLFKDNPEKIREQRRAKQMKYTRSIKVVKGEKVKKKGSDLCIWDDNLIYC